MAPCRPQLSAHFSMLALLCALGAAGNAMEYKRVIAEEQFLEEVSLLQHHAKQTNGENSQVYDHDIHNLHEATHAVQHTEKMSSGTHKGKPDHDAGIAAQTAFKESSAAESSSAAQQRVHTPHSKSKLKSRHGDYSLMQVKTKFDEAEFEAKIAKANPDTEKHSVTGHYKSLDDMPVRQELSLAQIGETESSSDTAVAQTMILKGLSILAKHVEKAWRPALTLSISEISKAEFMDKTWWVVMLLALVYGCRDAYFGSMAALLAHSFIAVAFGLWIERVVPMSTLHFITAGLFGLLTIFYANEWFEMTAFKDAYAAVDMDREAVAEDRILGAKKKKNSPEILDTGATSHSDEAAARRRQQSSTLMPTLNLASVCCFLAVFLAEWGDKTEVVMIRLVSELPVVPTWLGSMIGLSLVTVTALAPGACLDRQRFSERTLYAISALALATFTGLALFEGVKARTGPRD